MKCVFIVQARMTSSRLPGKVLRDLQGRPMLAQQLRRLQRCRSADDIVLATTVNATDDPVVDLARTERVSSFRGSEADVLQRFVGAARQAAADVVVRLTADCPLIDPGIVDRVVEELTTHASDCDYASNVLERTYPRGLDVEAFFRDTLDRMDRLGTSKAAREHVTVFLRSEQPSLFRIRSVADTKDNSDLRWTVDTEVDFGVIRTVYERLDLANRPVDYAELLAFARSNPELFRQNADQETWTPPR